MMKVYDLEVFWNKQHNTSNICSSNNYILTTRSSNGNYLVGKMMMRKMMKTGSNIIIRTYQCSHKNVVAFYPTCSVLTNTQKRCVKYTSNSSCHSSPLARRIMEIKDVASVSLAVNHIKVERRSHDHVMPWSTLKPLIHTILVEFFASDLPVYVESQTKYCYLDHKSSDECRFLSQHRENEAILEDLINTRIRSFVQEERGDVVFQIESPHTFRIFDL